MTATLADLRECRLSWTDDREPGLQRRRAGRGFTYLEGGDARDDLYAGLVADFAMVATRLTRSLEKRARG